MLKTNKIDVLIACSILFLAAVSFAAGIFLSSDHTRDSVEIYVDNKLYGSYSLDTHQCIDVNKSGEYVCTVEITAEGVRMLRSTCKNQICVESGLLTAEKAVSSDIGSWIVCLPNAVTVHLSVGGEQ